MFDHYQAMVAAICSKLRAGRQRAVSSDKIGGSTFSYTVWENHPHYDEATSFLSRFRREGAALREKIAEYNRTYDSPLSAPEIEHEAAQRMKVIIYAGQTVQESELPVPVVSDQLDDDDEA